MRCVCWYARRPACTKSDGSTSTGNRTPPPGRLYIDGESHPAAGYRLALGAGIPEPLCGWILHCGDRFDAGGRIPIEARIIAGGVRVRGAARERANVGDATGRWALISLTEQAGGRLDPIVIDALARVVERAAERVRGSPARAGG